MCVVQAVWTRHYGWMGGHGVGEVVQALRVNRLSWCRVHCHKFLVRLADVCGSILLCHD